MTVPLLVSAAKRGRRPFLPRSYATRVDVPNVAITGGALGGTVHLRHFNRVAFSRCRVVIPLFYGFFNGSNVVDTDLVGSVQIACSLEYPYNSGTRYSFLFSTVRNPSTTSAAANGYLISDWLDLGFTVPANTAFGTFTFHAVTSGVTPYGNVFTGGASYNEGAAYSATPQDLTVSGSVTNSNQWAMGPMLILTEGVLPSVALWGDSNAYGTGASSFGDTNGNLGWAAQYVHRCGFGYGKYAVPSERMSGANATNWRRRLEIFGLSNATHVLSNYGTNDIRLAIVTTLSAAQNAKQAELALYQQSRPGVQCYTALILPRTTSTDTWITTLNQTAQTNFAPLGASLREQFNDWLRGRPAGWRGVIDPNIAAETAQNSGLWVVNGAANYATADGTHPSGAMHSLIANTLPLRRIT
jgi:lysophospholipase L1-like esterase